MNTAIDTSVPTGAAHADVLFPTAVVDVALSEAGLPITDLHRQAASLVSMGVGTALVEEDDKEFNEWLRNALQRPRNPFVEHVLADMGAYFEHLLLAIREETIGPFEPGLVRRLQSLGERLSVSADRVSELLAGDGPVVLAARSC